MTVNLGDYAEEINEVISTNRSEDRDLMRDPYFMHMFYKTTRRFLSVMSEEERESNIPVKYMDPYADSQTPVKGNVSLRIQEAYCHARGIVKDINLPLDKDY